MKDVRVCVGSCFFQNPLSKTVGYRNWGLEIMANDAKKERERERENDHVVLNVASLSHAHTDVLCVIGGIVFPLPLGIAGKVSLPVSTHSNHTERVAQGCCLPQTRGGTQRKPSTLSSHCSGGVNLSGICWESGGNLLSPFLCLLASSFHV